MTKLQFEKRFVNQHIKPEICKMKFELQKTDSQTKARAGKITTDHGEILTPIFILLVVLVFRSVLAFLDIRFAVAL